METSYTQNKQVVRATFAAPLGVARAMLAHIGATRQSGYALNRDGSNVYTLRKLLTVVSMSTILTLTGVTAAQGDVGEIIFNSDNTITVKINGGTAFTSGVDTLSRSGRHGFYAWTNHAPKLDDFQIELQP